MKPAFALLALLFGGILIGPVKPATAADVTVTRKTTAGLGRLLPFPRGERAEAVWVSGGCWTQCSAHTAWALNDCLRRDTQGRCLQRTDAADRACQRTCRTRGGPYLPID